MVPLDPRAIDRMLSGEPPSHRSVALRHASLHGRPGLRGDDPNHPSSVVWLREGDDGVLEAFAAGAPEPMLGWLASQSRGRPIALLAPPTWEAPVRAFGDRVETGIIQTWLRPVPSRLPSSKVVVRRLTPEDGPAFELTAPSWALRSWGDFENLLDQGAVFGVPTPGGFVSLAWIYESDRDHDKIGVATLPRYQSLGLGRAAGRALVDHIDQDRRKHPLWVTRPVNSASVSLAEVLGFSIPFDETLLRWTPSQG